MSKWTNTGALVVSDEAGGGGGGGPVTNDGTFAAETGGNLDEIAASTAAAATEVTLAARTGSLTETAPATDTASSGINGRLQRLAQRITSQIALWIVGGGTEAAALRVTLANDSTGLVSVDDNGGSLTVDGTDANPLPSRGYFATSSASITRPANTDAYAINDTWANSTSVPTAGGFTFAGAARESGKSGIITDAVFLIEDTIAFTQGEIWIFNQAVTALNDNAPFTLSIADLANCIGKIPFIFETVGDHGFYHAPSLNIGFTCIGSADLRFLVRVKAAHTPDSASVLTAIIKCIQVN